MAFHSILFDHPEDRALDAERMPECFGDLNLDQVEASITAGREAYVLEPFFRAPLRELRAIHYRHAVFRDLEDRALSRPIAAFAEAMRAARGHLTQSETAYYPLQRQRWFLDAVELYCEAVAELLLRLSEARPRSRAFVEFGEYLGTYLGSTGFLTMRGEAQRLVAGLTAIQYDLSIVGARIEVRPHENAPDYGAEVSETFAKFAQGAAPQHRFRMRDAPEMNHVEAAILDRVALLSPQLFSDLAGFSEHYRSGWLDAVIRRFDREVQFYLAYDEHRGRFESAGLNFCYPEVTDRSKEVRAEAMFDLALAETLVSRPPGAPERMLVRNDFHLQGPERILVVSGANQGGKTTFARAFGQLNYLAALGCPVPARSARVMLFDEIYTHFEREETIENLVGKLEDELLRMHRILEAATSRSILVMNESFGSTTLEDARFLGRTVLEQIIAKDMLCVCVTFLDELAALDAATVSMVASVDPKDPAVRTFKVLRQRADGLAHAFAIARKYRLTYDEVRTRIASSSVIGSAAPPAGDADRGKGSPP